jgi:hypothetical protein
VFFDQDGGAVGFFRRQKAQAETDTADGKEQQKQHHVLTVLLNEKPDLCRHTSTLARDQILVKENNPQMTSSMPDIWLRPAKESFYRRL